MGKDKHRCDVLIFQYLDLEVREVLSGEWVLGVGRWWGAVGVAGKAGAAAIFYLQRS